MSGSTTNEELIQLGDGWAIAPTIESLGDGMMRRVRPQLGITAFGMNVKVMQPGSSSREHWHREQQEVIFVHAGEVDVVLGEETLVGLGAGAIVMVDPMQPHVVRVTSTEPAVLVMLGGRDGVVEGDAEFAPTA